MHLSTALLVVVAFAALSQAYGYRRLRKEDQCPEQGFFQDENDCQKFYRCADLPTESGSISQRYEFSCPPGTVFDENISVCNHANAVDPQVSAQCLAQVGQTLEEIYRRPSNDDGQYHKYYQTQGSASHPLSPVTSRPKSFSAFNDFNNKNKAPFFNVYQTQAPQAVYQTPFQVQVPQYHQQPQTYYG